MNRALFALTMVKTLKMLVLKDHFIDLLNKDD